MQHCAWLSALAGLLVHMCRAHQASTVGSCHCSDAGGTPEAHVHVSMSSVCCPSVTWGEQAVQNMDEKIVNKSEQV